MIIQESDTVVIFNYASGIMNDGFSLDNVRKNTGFGQPLYKKNNGKSMHRIIPLFTVTADFWEYLRTLMLTNHCSLTADILMR